MPISCCLVLANIYYAQPTIIDMAQSIGFNSLQSGLLLAHSLAAVLALTLGHGYIHIMDG